MTQIRCFTYNEELSVQLRELFADDDLDLFDDALTQTNNWRCEVDATEPDILTVPTTKAFSNNYLPEHGSGLESLSVDISDKSAFIADQPRGSGLRTPYFTSIK